MSLDAELKSLEQMIKIFCQGHKHETPPCADCSELLAYASHQLQKCPYGDKKPTCRQCPIHCYKPEMRARITEVMRYAGPRMLLKHPTQALRHLMHDKKQKPHSLPHK